MNKKARFFFIFLLSLIFIILSFYLLFLGQGYHFSFSEKKIYKTGGVYLKVIPKEAEVFLNNKFVKKTDAIFGSLFLQKLKPGFYWLEIKKENFFPWKKEIYVKENEVKELRHIILFPQKINFVLLQDKIVDFWPTENENEILVRKMENNDLKISLLEISTGREKPLEFSFKLKVDNQKVNLFLIEPNKIILNITDQNSQKEKNFVYEIGKSDFWRPALKKEIDDLNLKKEKKVNLKTETIFLFNNRLFKRNDFSQEVLMDGVNDFSVSKDGKKIAVLKENEIWIIYPEKNFEKNFLARFSEKIETAYWLNDYYLLLRTGGKIKIIEADSQGTLNHYSWDNFSASKIFWQEGSKKIILLSNGKIFISEKLF